MSCVVHTKDFVFVELASMYLDLSVADDSLLHQAIKLKSKGKVGLSRSATKPDVETSHAPTLQDNSGVPQTVIPLFKVRERDVTLGKCG
jgi:hypothetical protein